LNVLLDTHALLWAQVSPAFLTLAASTVVADPANIIYVSAASAWEIATKIRLGKLPEARAFERDFLGAIDDAGYLLLPISVETALRAGRLAGTHGDPFDRMIAAQALSRDMPVVSADTKLDSFGVSRIW
jgi:PIN domain nuclease of toxin-antitoxin system